MTPSVITVHRCGYSGGYWLVVIFLYLFPSNAAHAISCSSAVLAGESGGERINEKWALHEIYIRIIRCNIHLSLFPRAWRHARLPKRARTKGSTHTQMPRKLIMSDCSLFSCTTRGFPLKKKVGWRQTQNTGWQSNTGTIEKDSMSPRAAVHTEDVWM